MDNLVKYNKPGLNLFMVIFLIFLGALFLVSCVKKEADKNTMPLKTGQKKEVLYYTCGMHPSVRVTPEEYVKGSVNCPICNMKLVPVYKENKAEDASGEKKILYYRNPMNPSITSEVPTKDQMGMDYIPVYQETQEEEAYYGCGMQGAEHVFAIKDVNGMNCPICAMPLKKLTKREAEKLRGVVSKVKIAESDLSLSGIRTEPVEKLKLYKEIRTVGKVAFDPLLAVAEEELISSLKAYDKIKDSDIQEIRERSEKLIESAKRKLRLLGLSEAQINDLEENRQIQENLILPQKKMWIYGEVYEYELGWFKVGTKVLVTTASLPGEEFEGEISSLNPVFDPKTRSLTFRAEINNPDLKLKPEMYVDVVIKSNYIAPDGEEMVLAIPKNAVLDTGVRNLVWIDEGGGEFEGREVRLGPEASAAIDGKTESFYPVLSGLSEGEKVVTKANFLIDSQSQLTGAASSAYGGALNDRKEVPSMQH